MKIENWLRLLEHEQNMKYENLTLGHSDCHSHSPAVVLCPLLKISLDNPYLKILDNSKHFVADALRKNKSKYLVEFPLRALFNIKIAMHERARGFCFFLLPGAYNVNT